MYVLQREHLAATLAIYCEAWVTKNSNMIISIFENDATYHERVMDEPIRGHEGIKDYWDEKVGKGQDCISVSIVQMFVDGNVGIVEWEVYFNDLVQRNRKFIKEIAVLEFHTSGKIQSLREYWSSRIVNSA
jgi:hypothetical protein